MHFMWLFKKQISYIFLILKQTHAHFKKLRDITRKLAMQKDGFLGVHLHLRCCMNAYI